MSSAGQDPAALVVSDVSVHYGKALAVDACNIQVEPGERVGIVGPNGAGKSTLLKAMAGLLPLTSGAVRLGEVELAAGDVRRRISRGIALVPEGRHVFPAMTVRENLMAGAYLRPISTRNDELAAMLARFPILAEKASTPAGLLSGGQQQVLAIARGLMSKPRFLLLDEFSLGLSPGVIAQVSELVSEVVRSGVAVLLVEQNPSTLAELCSRVYLMRERAIDAEFLLPGDAVRLQESVRALV